MSYIEFRTWEDGVRVAGMERAMFAIYCRDQLEVSLRGHFQELVSRRAKARYLFPGGHYVHGYECNAFERHALMALAAQPDLVVSYRDEKVSVWHLQLNTMLLLGNPVMQFMGRVHGQCEVHAYIERADFDAFRGLLFDGLNRGLLRKGMGWEKLDYALSRCAQPTGDLDNLETDSPLVMSYSVSESFPPSPPALSEELAEAWHEQPRAVRWRDALKRIREPELGLRLDFDHLDRPTGTFGFGAGRTGYDVARWLDEMPELVPARRG